jgi:hypothetical protein
MSSKVSKLVETCWQAEKWLKGLKRHKSFCGFADENGCHTGNKDPFVQLTPET